MKNNSTIKKILIIAIFTGILSSCVNEDDTSLPDYTPLQFAENFDTGEDNVILTLEGWDNIAEQGDAFWKVQEYSGNGYAEFTSYQSGDANNVSWLVSPEVMLSENNTNILRFQVSQSYVSNTDNTLEVLISSDYAGDVTTATWTPVQANIPGTDAEYFLFGDSGLISLSEFSGPLHIAFKVTGSGTNTSLDGSYQIDNVRVY